MSKHIVVVGGGMAGTAAAHALRAYGYKVTIVEQNDRLGGRIKSLATDGTTVEMGAGFMTRSYSHVLAFLAETGLRTKLYHPRGGLGMLRGGSIKMATLSSLAGNSTLSWRAKLQVIPLFVKTVVGWRSLDIHAPWRAEKYDTTSVDEMFHGKAGKELLEYVAQPILNGYFYWTPERTSAAMLLIILKALFKGGTKRLAGGLQQIPERAAAGCEVLLECEVTSVQKNTRGEYMVRARHHGNEVVLQADGIVCATTASVVPNIIVDLSEAQKAFFTSITYSSTAVVAQVYEASHTKGDKGLAFPRTEHGRLAAITVSPEKTTSDRTLASVKVYATNLPPHTQGLSDAAIAQQLLTERAVFDDAVLLPNAHALTTHVQKWPEALPIFDHGHFHKLRQFAEGSIEEPGGRLVFAGDYLGGPLMEGAFTSGIQAADRLHAQLQDTKYAVSR